MTDHKKSQSRGFVLALVLAFSSGAFELQREGKRYRGVDAHFTWTNLPNGMQTVRLQKKRATFFSLQSKRLH